MVKALEMAKECMKANVDKEIPKGSGHATGTEERREAAQKRKAHNDMKPHSAKSKAHNCSSSSWQQAYREGQAYEKGRMEAWIEANEFYAQQRDGCFLLASSATSLRNRCNNKGKHHQPIRHSSATSVRTHWHEIEKQKPIREWIQQQQLICR